MSATLQDYDVAVDDVAIEPQRRLRWAWIVGMATIAVLVIGAILIAAVPSLHEDVVAGTATANHADVVAAAAYRKAQAEADQRVADAAYLRSLDLQVKQAVQTYFVTNDMAVTVIDVVLIKVSPTNYEGLANMQAAGHYPHQVEVHVTADDQHVMWKIDAGALLTLLS